MEMSVEWGEYRDSVCQQRGENVLLGLNIPLRIMLHYKLSRTRGNKKSTNERSVTRALQITHRTID